MKEEENIIEDKLEDKLDNLNLNENNLKRNDVNDTSKKDLDTSLPKDWRYTSSHSKELIIGDTHPRVKLIRHMNNLAFISQIEPKNIKEAESDPN